MDYLDKQKYRSCNPKTLDVSMITLYSITCYQPHVADMVNFLFRFYFLTKNE